MTYFWRGATTKEYNSFKPYLKFPSKPVIRPDGQLMSGGQIYAWRSLGQAVKEALHKAEKENDTPIVIRVKIGDDKLKADALAYHDLQITDYNYALLTLASILVKHNNSYKINYEVEPLYEIMEEKIINHFGFMSLDDMRIDDRMMIEPLFYELLFQCLVERDDWEDDLRSRMHYLSNDDEYVIKNTTGNYTYPLDTPYHNALKRIIWLDKINQRINILNENYLHNVSSLKHSLSWGTEKSNQSGIDLIIKILAKSNKKLPATTERPAVVVESFYLQRLFGKLDNNFYTNWTKYFGSIEHITWNKEGE